MGRYMMAPNLLAKEFDRVYGRPGQTFDLVVFLDGIEREQRSQVFDASSFRKSWQRPKWHILIQDYE